jgi:hypothetical protein
MQIWKDSNAGVITFDNLKFACREKRQGKTRIAAESGRAARPSDLVVWSGQPRTRNTPKEIAMDAILVPHVPHQSPRHGDTKKWFNNLNIM